jgi:hypothetical protein
MLLIVAVLWGGGTAAIWKSMHDEDRKLTLIRDQGKVDTYSPQSMADLRQWVEANPADPYAEEARERYNDCVDTLREIDEPFYDWSEQQIEELERL